MPRTSPPRAGGSGPTAGGVEGRHALSSRRREARQTAGQSAHRRLAGAQRSAGHRRSRCPARWRNTTGASSACGPTTSTRRRRGRALRSRTATTSASPGGGARFTCPISSPASASSFRFAARACAPRSTATASSAATAIMTELPFQADLTDAVKPGQKAQLAVRITNPGGDLDWIDFGPARFDWGKYTFSALARFWRARQRHPARGARRCFRHRRRRDQQARSASGPSRGGRHERGRRRINGPVHFQISRDGKRRVER